MLPRDIAPHRPPTAHTGTPSRATAHRHTGRCASRDRYTRNGIAPASRYRQTPRQPCHARAHPPACAEDGASGNAANFGRDPPMQRGDRTPPRPGPAVTPRRTRENRAHPAGLLIHAQLSRVHAGKRARRLGICGLTSQGPATFARVRAKVTGKRLTRRPQHRFVFFARWRAKKTRTQIARPADDLARAGR